MQRRSTSKKRAAEAEKEINMEDKEATRVEDVEMMLPPTEPTKPMSQEEQPEKSKTTEGPILDKMMEINKNIESTNKSIESTKQEIKSTKEELCKDKKEDNQSLNKKLEELKDCLLYTSDRSR